MLEQIQNLHPPRQGEQIGGKAHFGRCSVERTVGGYNLYGPMVSMKGIGTADDAAKYASRLSQ